MLATIDYSRFLFSIGWPKMRCSTLLLLVASLLSMAGCGGGDGTPEGHALPTSSALVATARSLDVGIEGDGLFVLQTADGQRSYSRLGRLDLDRDGQLIHADGSTVIGFSTGQDATGAVVGPLPKAASMMPPRSTTTVAVKANLDSRFATQPSAFDPLDAVTYAFATSFDIYGAYRTPARRTLTLYFSKLDVEATTGSASWVVHASIDSRIASTNLRLHFFATGELDTTTTMLKISAADAALATPVDVDFSGLSNFTASFAVDGIEQDGYGSGALASGSVEPDGRLALLYDNGQQAYVGTLALARFTVADRLQYQGDSSWLCEVGCLPPTIGVSGSASLGHLQAKALNADYR